MQLIYNERIWEGIRWHMNNRGIDPARLAFHTRYSKDRIGRGIAGESEQLTSDFLHACVEAFGLKAARMRSYEDTSDVLTDEECISLLIAPLTKIPRQRNFWG